MMETKVLIIGAGPAGIAASIQLKRYGIDFITIEKNLIGGLLKNANLIENYPGFPTGISGIEIIELFKKQLEQEEIQVIHEEVTDITSKQDYFIIKTNKQSYKCQFLIIASGTKEKKIEFDYIDEKVKNKIYYEVIPLLDKQNKDILIIGSGDAAFDYAINLSKNNNIRILNRSNRTKCLPLLIERVKKIKNIEYLENSSIKTAKMHNNKIIASTNTNEHNADYILGAIGRIPNLDFLQNIHAFDKIKENLFIIGDAQNGTYRQASISIGDGIKTAMMIFERLNSK